MLEVVCLLVAKPILFSLERGCKVMGWFSDGIAVNEDGLSDVAVYELHHIAYSTCPCHLNITLKSAIVFLG